jgi:hypothetical protein
MLAEETIQGGNLSAEQRSACRSARRLVTVMMALAAMTFILIGSSASVAAAQGLENNSPPMVSGHGVVGEELVCNAGSWTGFGVQFSFEWLRDGVVVATSSQGVYKVRSEDKGHSISCIVIATAGSETAEEESFNSIAIGGVSGTEPKNEELPKVSPSTATVGQRLTCQIGKWSGTPEIKYTYQWLRDGSKIEPAQTEEQYVVQSADEGHKLSCKVTATNGFGEASATSRSVEVPATQKPEDETLPEVHGLPEVEQELTCEHGEWKGEPTFAYQWLRDGSPIAGAIAQTYVTTSADETHTISCQVTGTNSAGKSSPVASSTGSNKHILGTAPEAKTLPKITGTAEVGHLLTCAHGEWNGTAPITFKYAWVRDRNLSEETTLSDHEEHLEVEVSDRGHTLSCVVTAENGEGSASQATEPVIVASGKAGAPENKQGEPPVATPSGPVAVGQRLKCEHGGWTGNPEFSYEWIREPGEINVALGEQEYTVMPADAGHSLVCKVIAKNSEGVTTARSNRVSVSGSAPTDESPPKVVGKPVVSETLTCSQGKWSGSPEPTFTYQWVRDPGPEETNITGETTNSYIVTGGDRGHTLACEVTASNSSGREVATSNALRIPGSQPENTEGKPPTIVGSPVVGEGLKCEPGEWTGAPMPTLKYQWLLDGTPVPLATQTVFAVVASDQGRVITCEVTGVNSAGSTSAISKGVHIPGLKPQDIEAPRVIGLPGLGGSLKCEPGEWAGKPPPSFEYEWLRNGSSITSRTTTETYKVAQADLGQSLACKVIANSTEGTAEAVSAEIAIAGGQVAKVESPSQLPSGSLNGDPPTPTATAAQILAKLASQLTHAEQGAHIASLLKTGAYKFSFTALAGGALKVAWYEVPKGAHVSSAKSKPKALLVASATVTYTGASEKTVKLRLTSFGRSLLKRHTSVKLTAKAVFTPTSGHPVTWIKSFTLKK